MPRFFIAGTNIAGSSISITGADAEHIKVLRMRVGERLVVCDGEGTDRHCRLVRVGDGFADVEVEDTVPCPAEASVEVTVLAGLPKGERADYIVQKCTECGARRIAFFQCERCVARLDGKNAEKKRVRWQRIAEEAAKQSGRGIIPQVSWAGDFADMLNIANKKDLGLFMYETGEREALSEVLDGNRDIKTAAIVTGPEGGFQPFEAELAKIVGLHICSMGERILRCETAPVVALTAAMYATGNLS